MPHQELIDNYGEEAAKNLMTHCEEHNLHKFDPIMKVNTYPKTILGYGSTRDTNVMSNRLVYHRVAAPPRRSVLPMSAGYNGEETDRRTSLVEGEGSPRRAATSTTPDVPGHDTKNRLDHTPHQTTVNHTSTG